MRARVLVALSWRETSRAAESCRPARPYPALGAHRVGRQAEHAREDRAGAHSRSHLCFGLGRIDATR